jgi:hypothetical protein
MGAAIDRKKGGVLERMAPPSHGLTSSATVIIADYLDFIDEFLFCIPPQFFSTSLLSDND